MKKFLLIVIMFCIGLGSAMAQSQEEIADAKRKKRNERMYLKYNKVWNKHKGYANIAYVTQTLSDTEGEAEYEGKWGASISWGRTFFLHKKPIARMMKFGVDWSWLDINASQYSFIGSELFKEKERYNLFHGDAGMQVGPSFTINPVHHLKLSVYYRLTPSYSMLYFMEDEEIYNSFALFTNMGASISWKLISLGIEMRSGKADYGEVYYGKFSPDYTDKEGGSKLKTESVRFYIGFRF